MNKLIALCLLAATACGQSVFVVPDGQDANGAISATAPAVGYDGIGNLWVKSGIGTAGWSKVISTSSATNPPTPTTTNCPPPGDMLTLRSLTSLALDHLAFGRSDTNTQWQWFDGANVNTNCWVWPMDFSGISLVEGSGQTITLITRKHGITCGHSPPAVGSQTVFIGSDLLRYTNMVWAVLNAPLAGPPFTSDLTLIQFVADFPPAVHPFPILPTNYVTYGDLGRYAAPRTAQALWYRPNTGRMNIKMISNWLAGTGYPSAKTEPLFTSWPRPLFTEGDPTGGDSGGPVFLIVDSAPVFLFATWFSDPMGPLVSYPGRPEWIQVMCGTNYPLSFADLSRYPQTP